MTPDNPAESAIPAAPAAVEYALQARPTDFELTPPPRVTRPYAPPPAERLLRTFDFADAGSIPKPRYLIAGLLPEGITIMYGKSGSYKSFIAIDMALAIALGTSWHGLTTVQGPVVYVAAEGASGVAQRAEAWQKRYGRVPPHRVLGVRHAISPQAIESRLETLVNEILAGLNGDRPILLVIDTLHANAPGLDENSSKDMGIIIAACRKLGARLNCSVLLVHHPGKDESKGMRGNSSLFGDVEGVLQVTATPLHAVVTARKNKDGPKEPSIHLSLEKADETLVVSGDEAIIDDPAATLSATLRQELAILARLGRATNKEWMEAVTQELHIGESTFQRHRGQHFERGLIGQASGLYSLTSKGSDALAQAKEPEYDLAADWLS